MNSCNTYVFRKDSSIIRQEEMAKAISFSNQTKYPPPIKSHKTIFTRPPKNKYFPYLCPINKHTKKNQNSNFKIQNPHADAMNCVPTMPLISII